MISDFLGFLSLLMRAAPTKTLSCLHLRRDETPAPRAGSVCTFLLSPSNCSAVRPSGWLFFKFQINAQVFWGLTQLWLALDPTVYMS